MEGCSAISIMYSTQQATLSMAWPFVQGTNERVKGTWILLIFEIFSLKGLQPIHSPCQSQRVDFLVHVERTPPNTYKHEKVSILYLIEMSKIKFPLAPTGVVWSWTLIIYCI